MRNTTSARVLVPVAILDGEVIPDQMIRLLSRSTVVLLGYHVLPEQTPPEQAREQLEAKAQAELTHLAGVFEGHDATVETRLVFTHDADQTIERIATETSCDAVLLSSPASSIDRIMVPIKEEINVETIAKVVAGLARRHDVRITLFHAVTDEADVPDGEALLEGVSDELVVLGIRRDQLSRVVAVASNPLHALVEAADTHDVVVMGEENPTIRGRLFGDTSGRVAEQTAGPVFVVRHPFDSVGDSESAHV